ADGPTTIELAALVVAKPGRGVGSALVATFLDEARLRGAHRVWVVTTNDNLDALRLYQRRGFRLVALRAGAVDRARADLKPSIGEVGENGIAIREEVELAIDLCPPPRHQLPARRSTTGPSSSRLPTRNEFTPSRS